MGQRVVELAMHSIGTKFTKSGDNYVIHGFCVFRFRDGNGKAINPKDLKLLLGNDENSGELAIGNKIVPLVKGMSLAKYRITIKEASLSKLDIQNKVQLRHGEHTARIGYSIFNRTKGKHKLSRIYKFNNLVAYVKQSAYNGMYLTIREPQLYDESKARSRVFWAWLLAKFYLKNDIIYIFEKKCSRYEESGSVLYEKLIDTGYDNAYFVVNEDNPSIKGLDEKYKKNLIYKDSFKHLLYFFKSKIFIGSEMMSHAVQLRTSDKRILTKTDSKDISYVFLQHGPTYMVPLDAEQRAAFNAKGLKFHRVVVSSQLEADHFVDCGGFKPHELYITGIAKFDKSIKLDDADKIVIMPTWRRWEANQARQDFTKTKYYKMIERMVDAVPNHLKEKIIVLPHPLMLSAMNDVDNNLKKYMATKSHDETLRECDLLITDYSSIAYDAYYRGSNVIFFWEEKDECMSNYGNGTQLLLTENLAFGDICYDSESLKNSVADRYGQEQKWEEIDNYRQIIAFHDNKNSDRIMECLKREGML